MRTVSFLCLDITTSICQLSILSAVPGGDGEWDRNIRPPNRCGQIQRCTRRLSHVGGGINVTS